jgi:4-alpha-glucanotransferase
VHWGLIELALTSPATLAIVPVQDVLGLGSGARMNRPGTTGGTNWRWRLEPGQLTDAQAGRLRDAVEASGRAGVPVSGVTSDSTSLGSASRYPATMNTSRQPTPATCADAPVATVSNPMSAANAATASLTPRLLAPSL